MRFINMEGVLVPEHVYRQAQHEKQMGYQVDPERLATAMNREMRRKLEKQARRAKKKALKDGKVVHDQPIVVPRPVSKAEAIDRVVDMIYAEMQRNTHPGTVVTFKEVLDRAEGKILERAWRAGHPIPRELVRRAVEEIYKRGERQRAAGGN